MALAHRAKNTYAALPFISTWKTDNLSTGSSTNTQVKLPLVSTGTYKFTVNWGDGNTNTITTWNQAEVTHTYASVGTYTITITGFIKGLSFGPETPSPPTSSDRLKLLAITQFGCLRFIDNAYTFHGCDNLTLAGLTDIINFKGLTKSLGLFRRCLSLGAVPNINKWDVSKIQSFFRFFGLCNNFNENIGNWNVGSGTEFLAMFAGFSVSSGGTFNNGGDPSIGNWDVSNARSLQTMFLFQPNFNQNIGAWDISKATTITSMFYSANSPSYGSFTNGGSDSIKNWDTSNVITMTNVFVFQPNFNIDISSWDTSKVTNTDYMFYGANSFNQPIGNWDTSKVTNMTTMFRYATAFNQPINNWNVSLVTNFSDFMRDKTYLDYSATNYDALLIGWASRPVKPNLSANFGTIKYTAAAVAARAILTSAPNNWTIVDGGLV